MSELPLFCKVKNYSGWELARISPLTEGPTCLKIMDQGVREFLTRQHTPINLKTRDVFSRMMIACLWVYDVPDEVIETAWKEDLSVAYLKK